MNNTHQHANEIEERYFALDIESLKQHDEGFKTAYDCGCGYELTIKRSFCAMSKETPA